MLHAGQQSILRSAGRFNAVACGRRFGKTTLGVAIAAHGAPHSPGGLLSGYSVGWFAPTYRLLDEAWRAARGFLRNLVVRTDAQQKRLELATGAAFDFWTLEDVDAGRGRKYGLVIVDEAAMARHLESTWNAAIRPTLTDYRGAAWFFSTPKGRNYFWQLYQLGTEDSAQWRAHHAPTAANPHIDPAEIEEARRNLPERIFAQEYLAEFLEDGAGVFRRVSDAIDDELTAIVPVSHDDGSGSAYAMGVDWGRHNDWTVITVIEAPSNRVVAFDRFNRIEYAFQIERLRALHSRFPAAQIVAEANAMGEPLIEQLQRAGLPVRAFTTTNASKAAIIESLSLALEQGELRIPRIPELVRELLAFDQERLASGAVRYGAPPGQHDDCVMSLALAWNAAAAAGAPSVGFARRPR
jgi:phage terminase large subunit-like protein